MNVGDERSRPLWMDVEVAPHAAALKGELSVDTVVIGGSVLNGPAIHPLEEVSVDADVRVRKVG